MDPTEPVAGIRVPDADHESEEPARGTRGPRGRQGAGIAAGALVVAAALAAVTLPSDAPDATPDRDPQQPTASPAPSDHLEQASVELIADPQSRLRDVGIAEDGTVAAVWESRDRTSQALAIDRVDGSTYLTNPGQTLLSLTPTPGGMLAPRTGHGEVGVLRSSGAIDPVSIEDRPEDPEPGDVAVDLGAGPRIFRPEEATVYRLPELPEPSGATARAGFITPDGVLVVSTLTASGDPGRAAGTAVWRDGTWDLSVQDRGPTALPGPVAGNGETAVVVRTQDTAGADEVTGIRVTHDAGRSWREVPTHALPSGSLTGVAVTWDGTTLLTDSEDVLTAVTRYGTGLHTDRDGVVIAVTRDGATIVLPDAPELSQLQAAGTRVWGVARYGGRGPMWWTDDAGATWHRAPPPGPR